MTAFTNLKSSKKKFTFTNNFHSSEAVCLAKRNTDGSCYLSKDQVSRARNKLCGVKGCTCAQNIIGERSCRSPVEVRANQDGSANIY